MMFHSRKPNWLRSAIFGLIVSGMILSAISCAGVAAPTPTAPASAPATTQAQPPAAGAAASGQAVTLTGAGSSFDNPLFTKAFDAYTKLHPNVKVNYQSIGSGAGIQQLIQRTVDFGATDAPMNDEQTKAAGGPVVHIPVTLGAVSVAYNLPGVQAGLKLDGQVLADIYLGKIKKWNDQAIAQLNPDLKLPATDIVVVHRSDGSGTTDIFTTYLSSVSPAWKEKAGAGLSVNWPVGVGAKGSEGVSGQVKQIAGGVGYFEMAYAKQNKLTEAAIADGAGKFAMPSTDGASACADKAAGQMPADLKVRIAGCSGSGVYPISGFSWVVLYQDQKNPAHGQAMVDLFRWLVTDGQKFGPDLGYAPLPAPVVKLNEQQLGKIRGAGRP
ncbi:MAG: phosphate ABC transporter substrate-binding protein PstS [Dehalococcoidales bacterium]|nr:phosphate ABC transporter substrate-binding protein PstS [Dehalococcoidales bacterium]